MADETNNANLSSLTVDLSALASFLVDLPPGALRGFQAEKDNYAKTAAELTNISATMQAKLGITDDIATIKEADEHIKLIDQQLPLVLKMAEVLRETRAKEVNRRERKISTICDKVETHVKDTKDETTNAAFTNSFRYRSQFADKAAKTRQKNTEAKAQEEK